MSDSLSQLALDIKSWGQALGFQSVGISDIDLSHYESDHFKWIEQGFHGEMDYMAAHGTKRTRPDELEPGTLRVISCRMNYYDLDSANPIQQLKQSQQAYISRYAIHKDYHKLMRKRLQKLGNQITEAIQHHQFRAFCDSAPVLERPLAQKAGLGFIGKNSLLIHPRQGSFFFLGELYTNLPLPLDKAFEKQGCGPCTACLQECPTQAILSDGLVDARRCISYLTIEYHGIIDDQLAKAMGNRIYGCDDCQLVCPWNKFTDSTNETAFKVSQYHLDNQSLLELLQWQEQDFLNNLAGSPIRRIGYQTWQRNLVIALGNADFEQGILSALDQLESDSLVLQHHKQMAIQQQLTKKQRSADKNSPKTPPPPLTPVHAKKYYLPTLILKRD